MATTDDKPNKVFIQIMGFKLRPMEWAINHFDSNNTSIILVNCSGGSILYASMWENICAEKKFAVETSISRSTDFKQLVLELITEQGMKKFVTCVDEWNQRQISELFHEYPNLSCKIWYVDDNGKLAFVRDEEYRNQKEYILQREKEETLRKQKEYILQREKEETLHHQIEIEQLKQNIDVLVEEIEQLKLENEPLKLENEELKNKLKENFNKLNDEMEEKQNLLVVIEVLTEERDKFHEERNDAIEEAERLKKERRNILNRSHSILSSEFTLQEIAQATENFSDSLILGEGGYGCVYKGTLRRMSVAIKKLNPSSMQGVSQFNQEIAILSQMRHPHLVTLIGSCSEASALIYEFLPNGSLESRLECSSNSPPLTWQIRTRIIGEICLALIFLHSCKPHLVIHGDLNPNNILLDANMVSKLADFGISRLVKRPDNNSTALHRTLYPGGTYAYSDPEYFTTGELTPKSDVYSLGILILRLLTRKAPLGIVRLVDEALEHGQFQSTIDASAGDWPLDQATKLAKIGLSCAKITRSSRPDLITEVWSVVEPLMKAASLAVSENHIPHHFMCPIFQTVMKDPHLAADGFTYEADAIKQWLISGHNTSPMTNLVLPNQDLIPNHVVRSAIQEWLEHKPPTLTSFFA